MIRTGDVVRIIKIGNPKYYSFRANFKYEGQVGVVIDIMKRTHNPGIIMQPRKMFDSYCVRLYEGVDSEYIWCEEVEPENTLPEELFTL